MGIYVTRLISVFFVCLVYFTTSVYANTSITVKIHGIVTSVNVKTPNGGTVPNDLSTVLELGQSVYATYTFNLPAVDFSEDTNVGFYREATSNFSVSINKGAFVWDSTGASIQVDSIDRSDRLIVITGAPIAPVTGTLVFGNIPSYQLVYGEGNPSLGKFLNNTTDIPSSGFLGLVGSIVVQYNDINAENEFVDTDIFFTTTSVSASYGTTGISGGCYTEEQMNQMVGAILTWGDMDGDKKITLIEAINALRVISGVTEPVIK
ncbi:MAG: hypothetical protein PF503_05555 [Desulfobacula sp.]|jgi:hypothetical protein|nr:hypothetical protein [Desulfobacula sp.]